MKISNKTYDTLCFISKYVLPALGALYYGLSQLWGFPYGEEVVGSISLIATFIAAILGASTYAYRKDING